MCRICHYQTLRILGLVDGCHVGRGSNRSNTPTCVVEVHASLCQDFVVLDDVLLHYLGFVAIVSGSLACWFILLARGWTKKFA